MRPRVFVLMYHAVEEVFPTAVAPNQFRREMRTLAKLCHVVRLEEIAAYARGQASLPDLSVGVTFDDGFESVYTTAFPIMAEYGVPSSVFITAGFVDAWVTSYPGTLPQRRGMSPRQLRDLASSGLVEIGAHTWTHPRHLNDLSSQQLHTELVTTREQLEDWTGQRVRHFAYPYSIHHPAVEPLLAQAGYEAAVGGRPRPVPRCSNPFDLPRVGTRRGATALEFRVRLLWGFSARAWILSRLEKRPDHS